VAAAIEALEDRGDVGSAFVLANAYITTAPALAARVKDQAERIRELEEERDELLEGAMQENPLTERIRELEAEVERLKAGIGVAVACMQSPPHVPDSIKKQLAALTERCRGLERAIRSTILKCKCNNGWRGGHFDPSSDTMKGETRCPDCSSLRDALSATGEPT